MQNDPFYTFWRKHWIAAAYIVAALLMLASLWLWCNRVQTNPERTFWGAVSHSLASSGVTVTASQETENSALKQTVGMQLGGRNIAHGIVTVTQNDTKITTEVVGTPEADYTRYTSITSGRDNKAIPSTQSLTNTWAKSEPQLFGQSTLGIGLSLGSIPVPVANATGEAGDKLLQEIKDRNLYRVKFDKVKKEHVNGRFLYTYEVMSTPFVYVEVLQLVAKQIGVKSLESIEPGEYRELKDITMRITVDVRARQVTKVSYDGANYSQHYSAYGVPIAAEIPTKTIPMSELQRRLQSATKQ